MEVTDDGVEVLYPLILWLHDSVQRAKDINLASAVAAVTPGAPMHIDVVEGKEYHFVTLWRWYANTFVIQQK